MSTDESPYLVGLHLAHRRVVFVGAGSVAQRRLPLLIESGADLLVISPAATPAVEALAASGQIELVSREYEDGDLAGAWYVIAATDDGDVNAAIVAEAERSRVFCVRTDRGSAGSAVTPATTTHDGVTLGMVVAVLIPAGVVTLLLRALPFSLLRVLKGSPFIEFLALLMPVGVMTVLVVYTLSGFAGAPARLWAALAALAVTLVLHWWKRRADLSILGGTALYMALVNLVL